MSRQQVVVKDLLKGGRRLIRQVVARPRGLLLESALGPAKVFARREVFDEPLTLLLVEGGRPGEEAGFKVELVDARSARPVTQVEKDLDDVTDGRAIDDLALALEPDLGEQRRDELLMDRLNRRADNLDEEERQAGVVDERQRRLLRRRPNFVLRPDK